MTDMFTLIDFDKNGGSAHTSGLKKEIIYWTSFILKKASLCSMFPYPKC